MTTFLRSLWATLFFVLSLAVTAQPFQNTAGTPQSDAYWGGLTIANGYIAVGTTPNNLGGNDLLLTQYNLNGTIAWSRKINVPTTLTTSTSTLDPRDIAAVPINAADPSTAQGGYYITGYEVGPSPNFPGNMFVLRTDNAGALLWFRTNIVPTLNIQQSEGVSVVPQSDGGVIAVGNARLTTLTPGTVGANWIMAARFSPAGVLMWGRIYGTAATGTNTAPNYLAHEATLNITGCAGTTLGGGVVIAGEVANEPVFATTSTGGSPGAHLLGLAIDGNGTECWRAAYPAYAASPNVSTQSSVGYDVTYSASLNNYVFVGKAQSAATANISPYIVRTATNGISVCSSTMNLQNTATGTLSSWYARGVTTSSTNGQIVIVGPNTTSNRTYAAEVNVGACPFAMVWDKEYPLSTANVVAVAGISGTGIPENITQRLNSTATGSGYFITTNTTTTSPLLDTHVISTNIAGSVLTNCPPIEVQPFLLQSGIRIELTPNNIDDASWNSLDAVYAAITLVENICSEQPACTVTAGFTFTVNGSAVSFVNTSTGNGVLTYLWNFGDGSTSTAQNPVHTYTAAGTYVVTLTVTNTLSNGTTCTQTISQTIVITPPTVCEANPNFCFTTNNNIVTFANSSTGNGILSYFWEFGDGTTSTAANPSKSYPSAGGNFTVCLTVTTTLADGTKCCKKCCKTITINPACTASANFRFTVNGTSVSFTNMSATGQTYLWTFGNGNSSTAFTPPTQNYAPGTYQVCLESTRTNTIGNCSKTICKTIVIDQPCNIIARFRPTVCINSTTVMFTNFSIYGSNVGTSGSITWEFGDGTTSTSSNPTHTYTSAGVYTVCLNVSTNNSTGNNSMCRSRVCQVINIEPAVCNTNCVPSNMIAPNEEDYQSPAYKSFDENSDLQVVPNPADDIVWISLPEKVSSGQIIEVYDMQGKLVASIPAQSPEIATELSVNELAKGMYFVTVSDDAGKIHTSKLIKE